MVLDPIVVPEPSLDDQLDYAASKAYHIPLWLAQNIRMAARAQGIPLPIAYALVRVESNFDSDAKSWAGARGLSQVMPETGMLHCGLAPNLLYVPHLNLNCGFSYLAMMYERYQDWRLALIAYNRGPVRTNYELANNFGHGTSTHYAQSILARAALD